MSAIQETVRLVPRSSAWSPIESEATRYLGDYLVDRGIVPTKAAYEAVKSASLDIVARCKPFDAADGRRTGLVVGYVQSGKTLSMTTVAAVARDNGCRIILALAGTKKNLLKQTRDRFRRDLRCGGAHADDWVMLDSVDPLDTVRDGRLLASQLQEWRDPSIPDELKKPLFITVMKQHRHLARLAEILSSADLRGVPGMIIDDEADQAGLNTRPDKDVPSTTYRSIREVRDCLPNHTYLQYTATPQAPLLISLADMLAPEFAEVLDPGDGYTGGQTFFGPGSRHVVPIPPEELFAPGDVPAEAPNSLLEALRLFFVGVAAAKSRSEGGPRSMLVHPSRSTDDHSVLVRRIEAIRQNWQAALALGPGEPDCADVAEEFRRAHADLSATDPSIAPFDERFLQTLRLYLGRTVISQVNSADGSEVHWDNSYSHILVGGDKLNRGYTVEGLTVTWMPRDAGEWNADTIQQRARFFGYKRKYLGLCRAFLHPEVDQAFRDYVEHEEDIRKQLRAHRGRPLREWKRAFFLESRMRPTRNNVLSDPYFRSQGLDWFRQRQPHVDLQALASNRTLVQAFRDKTAFAQHQQFEQHRSARVGLDAAFRSLLLDYEVVGNSDVVQFYSIRCWVRDVLDRGGAAECVVIDMGSGRVRGRSEEKDRAPNVNIHEGPRSGYPGDRGVREDGVVTIQIHRLKVETSDGTIIEDVPALAVWVPQDLRSNDVIVQPRS